MTSAFALHTVGLLAVLAASPFGGCDQHESDSAAPVVSTAPPTDSGSDAGVPSGGAGGVGRPGPRGGTPEPATLLLVGGCAAGYVAMRRRKKLGVDSVESEATEA